MLSDDTSRRNALKLLGAGAAMTAVSTENVTAKGQSSRGRVFTFNEMAGNQGPFVGGDGSIRGVNAGGLPWIVDKAQAKLHANGRLQVKVKGLVLDPDDDRVPETLAGTNPIPEFKAILSCLTFEDGTRETINTATGPVSASKEGDADINEKLNLPDPCYAPIVFVTSPGESWFATTGV